jgi:hypothetical protein
MILEKIKKIKIDISEDNDKIYCTVEIPAIGKGCKKKILVQTQNVFDHVVRKGHKVEAIAGSTKEINNFLPSSRNKATWSFSKVKPKPKVKKTTRTRARTAKPKPKTEK